MYAFVMFWDNNIIIYSVTNTTLNCLGCEILTMGAAVFHWVYFDYITSNYKLVPVSTNSSVSSEA